MIVLLQNLKVSVYLLGPILLVVFSFAFALATKEEKINILEKKTDKIELTIDRINNNLNNIENSVLRIGEQLKHITREK